MLRHVLFDLNFFDGEEERELSQKKVLYLLEVLTWLNQLYLRKHPETPLIYQSGIKYKVPEQFVKAELPEAGILRDYLKRQGASEKVVRACELLIDQCGGGEHFREIPRIIENGGGDCDNVACWRAAELREHGIAAHPCLSWRKRADGGTTYHVQVRYDADGSTEDPSLLLGMSQPERAADKAKEEARLGERLGEYMAAMSPAQRQEILGHRGGGHRGHSRRGWGYGVPYYADDYYDDFELLPRRGPVTIYGEPSRSQIRTLGRKLRKALGQ